jgi:hypothetical protein
VGGDPAGIDIGEDDGTFGVPCDGGDEPVEFAGCGEDILATEGFDGALADGFAHAHAFDEIEIAVAAGDSLDDEHADVVTATPCRIQRKTAIQPKMLLLHIFCTQMSPIIYQ